MNDVAAVHAELALFAFAEADPSAYVRFVRHPAVAFSIAPTWGHLFEGDPNHHADQNDFN
jgi:hypothetical protein